MNGQNKAFAAVLVGSILGAIAFYLFVLLLATGCGTMFKGERKRIIEKDSMEQTTEIATKAANKAVKDAETKYGAWVKWAAIALLGGKLGQGRLNEIVKAVKNGKSPPATNGIQTAG